MDLATGLAILGVVFMIAEIFIPTHFAFLSLGVALLLAGGLTYVGVSFWIQIPLCGAVGLLILVAFRRWMQKTRSSPDIPTFTPQEELVGREGIVVEVLDIQTGIVRVRGQEWRARWRRGSPEKGQRVRILALEGITLIVEPASSVSFHSAGSRTMLVVFFLMLLSFSVVGMEMHDGRKGGEPCRKGKKAFQEARMAIQQGDRVRARKALRKLIRLCPDFADAYAVLGDLYRNENQLDSARMFYVRAILVNPDMDPTIYWLAGQTSYMTGKFDSAVVWLEEFLRRTHQGAELDSVFRARVHAILQNAKVARELVRHPVQVKMENLGPPVNTRDPEYFPSMTVDRRVLVFTRRVRGFNEDFILCTRSEPAVPWETCLPLPPPVNTPSNEGTGKISLDGRWIFYTVCGDQASFGRCDLVMAEYAGNQWMSPRLLPAPVNGPSWESHPCLSPDGSRLFFVSDRPGGLGGADIWIAEWDGKQWSHPYNPGKPLNTPGDELSPFLHPDGETFYFASRGHPSIGKADLFISRWTDTGWTQPRNLGYPINTPGEESGLIVDASGRYALFQSERPGGMGSLDIYWVELPEFARARPVANISGRVVDDSGRPVGKALVEIHDLQTGKRKARVWTDSLTGGFLLPLPGGTKYAFHVYARGYSFHSEHLEVPPLSADSLPEFRMEIELNKLVPGTRIILRNIFFETASAELSEESRAELHLLVKFLRENPDLVVEIAGHTDDVGPEDYNMRLSEARARAVYEYLVQMGISPQRMTWKGYGESQPLVRDTTEWARAQNRRTEIRIIRFAGK